MGTTFHFTLFNPFGDFKHMNVCMYYLFKKNFFMVSTFITLKDWELQEYFIHGISRIHRPQIVIIPSSTDPQVFMFLWRLYHNISFRLRVDKKCLMTDNLDKGCMNLYRHTWTSLIIVLLHIYLYFFLWDLPFRVRKEAFNTINVFYSSIMAKEANGA